ncbi:Zn(II)2Cys6 transcription factor domain-containing protein ASCRUDRAFT_75633, partial [Ascoidea rubescens DSM 1968]
MSGSSSSLYSSFRVSNKAQKRKKHTNSKLGCKQCKERRIKCDETFPECLKCQRYNNNKKKISKTIPHDQLLRCSYCDYTQAQIDDYNFKKNTIFISNNPLSDNSNNNRNNITFASQNFNIANTTTSFDNNTTVMSANKIQNKNDGDGDGDGNDNIFINMNMENQKILHNPTYGNKDLRKNDKN